MINYLHLVLLVYLGVFLLSKALTGYPVGNLLLKKEIIVLFGPLLLLLDGVPLTWPNNYTCSDHGDK